MTDKAVQENAQKDVKRLRKERKETIAAVAAKVKAQNKAIQAIKAALAGGGKTVPEMAEETGLPTSEVFWYIAALKKYGDIAEGEQDGSYFRYVRADGSRENAEES